MVVISPRIAERAEVLAGKEREAAGGSHRAGLPSLVGRADRLAASSMTATPAFAAASRTGSMSAHRPYRCTGMMARVRSVSAASTAAGSRLYVAGSMSTSTGVAPTRDDAAGGREE